MAYRDAMGSNTPTLSCMAYFSRFLVVLLVEMIFFLRMTNAVVLLAMQPFHCCIELCIVPYAALITIALLLNVLLQHNIYASQALIRLCRQCCMSQHTHFADTLLLLLPANVRHAFKMDGPA